VPPIGLGVVAALGGAFGGLWLSVIGVFLLFAAGAEEGHQKIRKALTGHRAGELMTFPAVVIPADLTIEEAVAAFTRHRYGAFPVLENERVIGLLTIDRVEALAAPRRASALARDLVESDPDLFVDKDTDVAEVLERPGFQRVGRAAVLTERGVGILSITEVQRAVRATQLTPDGPGSTVPVAH
jgi:predicted transcriptional regulator